MQIPFSAAPTFVGATAPARAEALASPNSGATPRDARTLRLLENMLDGMAALYWSPTFTPDAAKSSVGEARDAGSRSSRSQAREQTAADRTAAAQRVADGKQAAQPFHELIAEARRAHAAKAEPTPDAHAAPAEGDATPAKPLAANAAQSTPAAAASSPADALRTEDAATKQSPAASATAGDDAAKPPSQDTSSSQRPAAPPAFGPGLPIPPAQRNSTLAAPPTNNQQAAAPVASVAPAANATGPSPTADSANATIGASAATKRAAEEESPASKQLGQSDAKPPADAGENDASELRVEKLLRLLQGQLARREGRAMVRLDPPELGVMQVELRMERGEIGVVFEAESAVARDLLSTQLDELRQGLEEAGLRVHRLETRLKDEPIHQPPTGQATLREERSSPREDADSHRQGSRHATGLSATSAPGQEAAGASEPRVVAPRRVLSGASDALDLIA